MGTRKYQVTIRHKDAEGCPKTASLLDKCSPSERARFLMLATESFIEFADVNIDIPRVAITAAQAGIYGFRLSRISDNMHASDSYQEKVEPIAKEPEPVNKGGGLPGSFYEVDFFDKAFDN